jgi:hypothetical protein
MCIGASVGNILINKHLRAILSPPFIYTAHQSPPIYPRSQFTWSHQTCSKLAIAVQTEIKQAKRHKLEWQLGFGWGVNHGAEKAAASAVARAAWQLLARRRARRPRYRSPRLLALKANLVAQIVATAGRSSGAGLTGLDGARRQCSIGIGITRSPQRRRPTTYSGSLAPHVSMGAESRRRRGGGRGQSSGGKASEKRTVHARCYVGVRLGSKFYGQKYPSLMMITLLIRF